MTVKLLPVIRPSIKLQDISVISRKPLIRYYGHKFEAILRIHLRNKDKLEEIIT